MAPTVRTPIARRNRRWLGRATPIPPCRRHVGMPACGQHQMNRRARSRLRLAWCSPWTEMGRLKGYDASRNKGVDRAA